MLEEKQFNTIVGGTTITIKTGKLAGQAGGAVLVQSGETVLLATATMNKNPREGVSFLPLTVDYEERLYAGGRIPGSFFRREGRPSEAAILIARLTDRSIRPLFPKELRNEIQVILYALSADGSTPIDVLALLGASTALTISDIPFDGPIGAVRVGRINGEFAINPNYQQLEESDIDFRLAGTRDAILMVECSAKEVDEEAMVSAIEAGQTALAPLIDLQEEMRAAVGKPKREFTPVDLPEGTKDVVLSWLGDKVQELISAPKDKAALSEAYEDLASAAVEALVDEDHTEPDVRKIVSDVYKNDVRKMILDRKVRVDGRAPGDIREINAEVDLSPRAHGSGLFTRGETQVLSLATLGTPRERQELDGLSPVEVKRYMHHYNFPPFSVGEARFLRGASRREVGHGSLAERSLVPVLPPEEEFPYTIRIVSEVLSSNGSTSMASVCGSTLALLDTGVPIKAPVAGIAMGMVKGDDHSVVLTDIQGVEDQLGDMDFKVAGTRSGITSLQMDIKVKGISTAVMSEALAQARDARLHILEKMHEAMPTHRDDLKPHTPRMTVIKVDPEKIGAIIGPGGKMVRAIQEQTGVRIDIEDDGRVFVAASDGEMAKQARDMIEGLIEEAEVGRIYTGKVVRVTDFGAFVEILPNTDGLVHISQLDSMHIEKVEDVARVGEEITVMVTNIDHDGKIRLSRQAVLEGWTAEEAMERDRRPKRRSGGGSRSGRQGDRNRGNKGQRNR
jgi:polyribonucleotide nucleotidyltransferase